MLIRPQDDASRVLKGFSYAMIAAFAGGLAFTVVGAAQAMMGL